jgi:hypothetical protein
MRFALLGPDGMVHLDAAGIRVNTGSFLSLKSSGNAELRAGGGLNVQTGATTSVNGSLVQLNGCGGFVARLGDGVQGQSEQRHRPDHPGRRHHLRRVAEAGRRRAAPRLPSGP